MSPLSTDGRHDYGTIPDSLPPSPPDSAPSSTLARNDSSEAPLLPKNDGRQQHELSLVQTCVVIFGLSGVTFSASMAAGLLVVGLPFIARDLELPEHLLLWPSSAYALACGCCLLLAGSIADRVGDRTINMLGSVLMTLSVAGTGLSADGIQLIAFRVLQGIGVSMCLPTGVSILTRSLPQGRSRNVGFSCLGVSQPLGFSLGLVMEGTMEELGQWRFGYYMCAGILGMIVVSNWVNLPADVSPAEPLTAASIVSGIDWVGVFIASAGLGLISYTCAVLTEDIRLLWREGNMTATVLGMIFLPAFFWWTRRQESLGRPALIPNSIWKNRAFLTISLAVLLTWGSFQSSILLTSLFFQKVQQVTPLEASFRLVPNVIVGIILNPVTGLCVQYFACYKLLASASLVAAVSPLLMAIVDPTWSWWACSFWSVALGPVSVNVLFTLAHIVITDVFPSEMHALAGAVFNTIAQLGTSLGVSLIGVIASSVTKSSGIPGKNSPESLMAGYRASFGTCFAMMVLCAVSSLGVRSLGKLGTGRSERGA